MAKRSKSRPAARRAKTSHRAPAKSPAKARRRPAKPPRAKGKVQGREKAALVPTVLPPEARPERYGKGGPAKSDLKKHRETLLAVRRSLLSSSTSLAAEALKASGQDFSVDHMADHGTDNYEQDFNLKLLEGEADQLGDIRDALLKIDGKALLPFGICEACAEEPLRLCESCPWIPESRLSVLPHARLCVRSKELQERGKLS